MNFNPTISKSPPRPLTLKGIGEGKKQVHTASTSSSKKLNIKKATPLSQGRTNASSIGGPASFESSTLATLTRSIRAINAIPPQPIPESLQALCSLCEGYITATEDHASILYDRIRIEVERRVGEIKVNLLSSSLMPAISPVGIPSGSTQGWLVLLFEQWTAFQNQLNMIRGIFLHLDRGFVLQRKDLLSIWDLGLVTFQNKVVHDPSLASAITASLIDVMANERDGKIVDRRSISSVLCLLSTLSSTCFASLFVLPFIEASRAYYKKEGITLTQLATSQANAPSTYLRHINQRLAEESDRASVALEASATDARDLKASLLKVVEVELIEAHTQVLLEGLPTFVESFSSNRQRLLGDGNQGQAFESDLSRLYAALRRVHRLDSLLLAWYQYVEATGSAITDDQKEEDRMVESLLQMKQLIDSIIAGPFQHNVDLAHKTKDAYEVFVNKKANRVSEMLAKYIDIRMRSGHKALAERELESLLDQVLALFRFTSAKDLFEAFYMRLFAKRLLLNKSASSDMEKLMLVKLREECGAAFTAKLETMAKDIDLSNDLMVAYKQQPSVVEGSACDLAVNVLTTGNWPSFLSSPCTLPAFMVRVLDNFKLFYATKHSGRTITWQHSLDQCVLKAQFPSGRKDLSVTLFQTLILLCFNNLASGSRLSFREIVSITRLDVAEASRTLQSLACGKVRVLTKHPRGRDVESSDEFEFNEAFKDDHVRIKINQIQQKETAEENKQTTDRVFVDRQNHIQLVVVRTMKSRKTLQHSALVMEVVSQLKDRFKVETTEIKKAITSLIERDYMCRDATEKNVYNYVA